MNGVWQWQELAWDSPMAPAVAAAALERLATAVEVGPVVLEQRAWAGGLRWLAGCQQSRVTELRQLLSHHLPVRLHRPQRHRPTTDQAVRLQVRGSHVSMSADRVVAATRALYACLSGLTGQQQAVLQLLIGRRLPSSFFAGPPAPGWRELLLGVAPKPPERPATQLAEQHGAAVCLRLGHHGTPAQSHQLFSQLLGALRIVETPQSRFHLSAEAPNKLDEVARPWRWPLRLRSGQMTALSGWPIGEPPLPGLGSLHPRLLPPPPLPRSERVIGLATTSRQGQRQPVTIPIGDAAFHTHLLGPTGAGKSTVLLSLALADVQAGRGVLLLDPKGDLATDLLARIPPERQADVVVIDPTNSAPGGLNPLAGPLDMAPVTADSLLGTLAALFHEHWGIRTADVLSAALLTLARTPGANLLWLPPLLTDPAFRQRVLAGQDDPLGTDAFWAAYQAKKPQAQATEIAPVLNKLRQLILRPQLRAMLGQSQPRFHIRELLTKRRIVVVNLNRGLLGAEAAHLLGSLLVSQLWSQLLARQALPPQRRHVVSIYIDEAHDFINGLPGDLSQALAQARSLGGALHLAHQYRAQLSASMVQALETNARNKIYFGLSGTDAAAAARLAPELEAQDFIGLPAYQAYATLMQRGQSTGWLSITTQPPPPARQEAASLYAASHQRYGVPAAQTEQQLMDLTAPSRQATQPPDAPAKPSTGSATPDQPGPIGRRRR